MINSSTQLYGLIGQPVEGSLSPQIHNYFTKIAGYNSIYMTFNIDEKNFENIRKSMETFDIKGINVTSPYKLAIIPFLDDLDESAKEVGSVNTVKVEDGKFIGYNTDGLGFVQSLRDRKVDIKDKKILVLGAGGAVRGILSPLLKEAPKKIYIYNRSKTKAVDLVRDFDRENLEFVEDLNLVKSDIDLLINGTTVGMQGYLDQAPIDLEGFRNNLVVADLIYRPLKTKLLREAEEKGYEIINGIGMLVNQAIYSQEFWRDIEVEESLTNQVMDHINSILK